jgi:Clp protease
MPLLAAGTKDLRFALRTPAIMVHQPSGGFQDQATDIIREKNKSSLVKSPARSNVPIRPPNAVSRLGHTGQKSCYRKWILGWHAVSLVSCAALPEMSWSRHIRAKYASAATIF